jgi:hypothetical protein
MRANAGGGALYSLSKLGPHEGVTTPLQYTVAQGKWPDIRFRGKQFWTKKNGVCALSHDRAGRKAGKARPEAGHPA